MTEADEQRQRARAAREALVGKTIAGKYLLQSLLGHGGMGAVYEAEHTAIGKKVAIKFVDPEFATDESVVKRFSREARAMSAIESAHIVTVFDAGTEDGRPYLVMELLRGEDLGQRLRRSRRVPLGESMHVIAQVLKGLARAHAAGIVHRDLKPDNVFLAKTDTDPMFAKIVDFGISKIERPRATTSPLALTGRGTVLGTPLYMSPEQAQCATDVDSRADLYSVGAMLFECLSGRPPHTGETYEQIILSICMRDAPDLRAVEPSVPENVSQFVARALARERGQRYSSAERMLAALHEVAPAERTRVPLDAPAQHTMLSSGAESAKTIVTPPEFPASPGVATRLGMPSLDPVPTSEKPSTRREPAAAPARSTPEPPRKRASRTSTPEPPAPKKKSAGALAATAIGATIAGIAATIGIVYATSKPTAPARPVVQETTSAAAPAPSHAPSVAFAPLEEPSASASTKPAATGAPKTSTLPSLPSNRPPGKPAPKLDIQRDLP
ncbi:MAG TPA: protein kinase [Labilithrix sp.]